MLDDLRQSAIYQEAEALFELLRRPGSGAIIDAAEVHASADGGRVVFTGSMTERLEGTSVTRVCVTDLATCDTRVLSFGPNIDRSPRFSPDGRRVAFLSDRREAGQFQLYLLDCASGVTRATPAVDGWVEYLHWSPDGRRILLGVAGHGVDLAGAQGAVTTNPAARERQPWMPTIETLEESHGWRRAWIYETASNRVRQVSRQDINVWEAVWCGNESIAAVGSPGPAEGLWYSAHLYVIDLRTGEHREIYTPEDQLGLPSASPSGRHLVVVDGLCSDRCIVAGELRLIETATGGVTRVDAGGVDITCTEWRSDRILLLAGHRRFETVVALYDVASETVTEVWSSAELSSGGFYVSVSGIGEKGDCVLVGESYTKPPEIATIRHGQYEAVRSFDPHCANPFRALNSASGVSWKAPDGLDIEGWLLSPRASAPHPLIMFAHGGPVWHWHPRWLGRWGVSALMLLKRGYALFYPNPRGSSGRGKGFIRPVYGDMGGNDARDLLAGVDSLIAGGVADAKRLGIMGNSYGGFMTSWLIGQDERFAAAVSISAHNNQVTEHLLSNIPEFMALLLQDHYNNPRSRYFERSPIMHAHKVRTPILNICGALDRCTPPEEAAQFHNAMRETGARSVLVTYPQEGHGVRRFPAVIDFTARIVSWFEEHIPADSPTAPHRGTLLRQ